ncbi:uncharacterized protein [Asterias amurensis]|uniref:uncharacterized protein isoform X2 n=1 Tax=Asterias amurensis TaxID=7602 RepID=UPI003AB3D74F
MLCPVRPSLVLLLSVTSLTYCYWLPWTSREVTDDGRDDEPRATNLQCDGPLTQIECRVRYTQRPYSETGAAVTCSLEDGLACFAAEDAGHCPDFETRYWCNYTGGLPIYHKDLSNGPRLFDSSMTPEEFCSSLDPDELGYNVIQPIGAEFGLTPAPPVLNYACSISISSGAYIDLYGSLCSSDPSRCRTGNSTWSIWLKINHTDNLGDVVFVSSGSPTATGVFVSQTGFSGFRYGATAGVSWLLYPRTAVPDGEWFHLAMTINYNNEKLSGYINGQPDQINIGPNFRRPSDTPDPDSSLLLGAQTDMTGQQSATASYSDLRLYEKLLDPVEIEQIHSCGTIVGNDKVMVWKIQPLESRNPNELRYQCTVRSIPPMYPAILNSAWRLYTPTDYGRVSITFLRNTPTEGTTVTQTPAVSPCFYQLELVIDKDKLSQRLDLEYLGTQEDGSGTPKFLACDVWNIYETLELHEDLSYSLTQWYSSTRSMEDDIGDNETIANINKVYEVRVCGHPIGIECRQRYTMKSWSFLVENEQLKNTTCDQNEGLICLHDNQCSQCPDFEVRFLCAGKRDNIEIQSLFVTEMSMLRLQAECSTSPGPYTISWGLYTLDTDNLTSLDASTSGVSIVEALDGAVYKSTLTLDYPPLGRYAYIVCNVTPGDSSSGLQPVYDSLKIDNAWRGKLVYFVYTPADYGSDVSVRCEAHNDMVHEMQWKWAPLKGTSGTHPLNPLEPYSRTGYMGGISRISVTNFQPEDNGKYICVINWLYEVALTLQGPTIVPTSPAPTTPQKTTTSAPTTITPSTIPVTTMVETTTMKQSTTSDSTTSTTSSPPTWQSTWQSTRQSTVQQSTSPSTTHQSTSPSTEQSTTQASDQSTRLSTTLPSTIEVQTEVVGVTQSWCSLPDVNSYQSAIDCSNASRLLIGDGMLSDDEKEELQDFLKLVGSLPSDVQLSFSETDAITELTLGVFVKLTDEDQKLPLKEEMDILADTEEALKLLAGTLLPQTCTQVKVTSSSANLCHASSLSTLDGYTYTHKVGINPNETGEHTASYEETLEFDLSKEDPDAAGEVKLVIMRKERAMQPADSIDLNHLDEEETHNKSWIELNSAFLTFSIYEDDIRKSVPVIFSLSHNTEVVNGSLQNNSVTVNTTREAVCVFWDTEETNPTTQWSPRGCGVVPAKSAKSFTQCSCNHSTNFAVLMQVKSYEISSADSVALTWITYIGCSTSMIMLVLTLTVFCYLGSMLRSDRIFIHTNLSIAILLAQILFIAGIDRTENRIVCKVVALSLHFSYLSVFGWMMVEGLHLYMKVVKVYGSENIKMYPYLLIGWGIPGIITLVSFGASTDGYGTGTSCWLDISSGLIWAFVAPALVVIAINMIVLLLVVRIIIKSAHLNKEKHYDHIKAGIKGAVVLLPILGLTWVFGLLAVNSATIVFQYLFTIFNSFQGLFIFLIHCVFNSEVKAALKRKREKRKLNNERNTMENSMTFVYSSKKSTDTQNSPNTSRRNMHRETTDTTSLSSGLSSRPGSGLSLFVVTPTHKHKNRPHSGNVAPMVITEADDEALLYL